MRLYQVFGYGVVVIGILATLYFGSLFILDLTKEQGTISDVTFRNILVNQVEIKGSVRNTGGLTLNNVWVHATLDDQDGNQTQSLCRENPTRLLPGGSATFHFTIDDPKLKTRDIQVNIKAVQGVLMNW